MAKSKQGEVMLDRRMEAGRREGTERRKEIVSVAMERRAGAERRKVPRRRQIDPTTCERDYSNDEIEFMHALDAYKRANGRMFPTCSEILEVIRSLGYAKAADMGTPESASFVDAVPPATGNPVATASDPEVI